MAPAQSLRKIGRREDQRFRMFLWPCFPVANDRGAPMLRSCPNFNSTASARSAIGVALRSTRGATNGEALHVEVDSCFRRRSLADRCYGGDDGVGDGCTHWSVLGDGSA